MLQQHYLSGYNPGISRPAVTQIHPKSLFNKKTEFSAGRPRTENAPQRLAALLRRSPQRMQPGSPPSPRVSPHGDATTTRSPTAPASRSASGPDLSGQRPRATSAGKPSPSTPPPRRPRPLPTPAVPFSPLPPVSSGPPGRPQQPTPYGEGRPGGRAGPRRREPGPAADRPPPPSAHFPLGAPSAPRCSPRHGVGAGGGGRGPGRRGARGAARREPPLRPAPPGDAGRPRR